MRGSPDSPPASGTDVAVETAHVVLTKSHLSQLLTGPAGIAAHIYRAAAKPAGSSCTHRQGNLHILCICICLQPSTSPKRC